MQAAKEGRRPSNPNHPIWAWLASVGLTAAQYMETKKRPHQVLTYYLDEKGERWAPLDFVEALAMDSRRRVRPEHFPRVRDRKTGARWRYGKLVPAKA